MRDTLDQLLREFLIHQNPTALKEYIATLQQHDGIQSNFVETADSPAVEETSQTVNETSTQLATSMSSDLVDLDYEKTTCLDVSELEDFFAPQTSSIQTTFFEPESIDEPTIELHHENSAPSTTVPLNEDSIIKKIGPYQHARLLGKGGMGTVWQVRDPFLNRTMALKVLHEDILEDPSTQSNFDEEAQISAQLQHPGIIPIYSYDRINSKIPYLTMKEVKGKTLKTIIQEVHMLPSGATTEEGWNFRRIITAFQSVCETMAYAHSRGVIHRDLKPSNIMVGKFGEVLVVDWGIAKVIKPTKLSDENDETVSTTRSRFGPYEENGMVLGTPAYMSPEQALGQVEKMDHRSDIYSLGVILYQILTGETYHKGTIKEILKQKQSGLRLVHLNDTISEDATTDLSQQTMALIANTPALQRQHEQAFLPPEFVGIQLPPTLVRICERAMQYNISERYNDALEIADDIRAWLDGAERKEKAMAILDQVQTLEVEQTVLMTKSLEAWRQADQVISSDNHETETGWSLWHQSQKFREQFEANRQEMHQLLQGALIYDPELTETHHKLVAFEYEDFLSALLDADTKRQQMILRRMRIYLESLPQEEAQYWRERKNKDHRATTLLRKRRGRFIGRTLQKQHIFEILQQHNLITLIGTAGVGKTHLVLEVINHWRSVDDQDALFCDLSTTTDLVGIEQELAKVLSLVLPPDNPWNTICEALHSHGKMLLVFDNVEQVIEPAQQASRYIIESCPNLHLVITSRLKLGLPEEEIVRLNPMSTLEGIELFLQRAQQAYLDFRLTEENREVISQIVQKLDRLPLAIELAAARTSTLAVSDILHRLSERFSLLQGRMRDNQRRALLGALDWSWDLLSSEVQSAFAQCSVFRNGFDLLAAEAIIDISNFSTPVSVMDMLEALYDDNLINKERQDDGRFRYTLLASMQEYTAHKFQQLSTVFTDLAQAPQRHANYYGSLYNNNRNTDGISKILEVELNNLMKGVEKGLPEDSFHCCSGALQHFSTKGPIKRGIGLTDIFLSREDILPTHCQSIQMTRIRFLRISGQMKEARLEMKRFQRDIDEPNQNQNDALLIQKNSIFNKHAFNAEDIPQPIPSTPIPNLLSNRDTSNPPLEEQSTKDLELQADRLLEQGNLDVTQSMYEKALDAFNQALSIYENLSATSGIVRSHLQIGHVYDCQSLYDLASQHCHIAKEVAKENHLNELYADSLNKIGEVDIHLGDYPSALENFTEALTIAQDLQDAFREAWCISKQANALQRSGEYKHAITLYNQSSKIAEVIGDIKTIGDNMGYLSQIYSDLQDYDLAIEHCIRATEIFRTLGDKRSEGLTLGNLGRLYQDLGQIEAAIDHYNQDLAICREIGDTTGEGSVLGNLGTVYLTLCDYQKAIELFTESVAIAKQYGNIRSAGIFLGNLGNAHQLLEEYDLAIDYYTEAIDISRTIGNRNSMGGNLGNLGELFSKLERWDDAEQHLVEGIELCKTTYPLAAGAFASILAWVYAQQSQVDKGMEILSEYEPLMQASPLAYAKFLCKKSKVLHIAKQHTSSLAALDQAKQISKELHIIEDSELGQMLIESTQFLASPPTSDNDHTTQSNIDALKLRASQLIEQGNLDEAESMPAKALTSYTQALAIYIDIGSLTGQLQAQLKIANIHKQLKAYEESRQQCLEIVTVAQTQSIFGIQSDALSILGEIERNVGNFSQALEYFEQALQIVEELDDKFRIENTCGLIGILYKDLTEYEKAIEYYTKSLLLSRELGNKRGEGETLGNIGVVWKQFGDYEKAIEYYKDAARIALEIGNKRSRSTSLENMALTYMELGKYNQAIEVFHECLALAKEISPADVGHKLGSLGNMYRLMGDSEQAIIYYEQAKQAAQAIGDKKNEGVLLGNLGNAYHELGQYEESRESYNSAIELAREIDNKKSLGFNLGNIGNLFIDMGRWDEAEIHLTSAVDLCSKFSPVATGAFSGSLAWVYAQDSRIDEAVQLISETESLVKVYPLEHAKFLCKKSKILHMSNQPEDASRSLEQANAIAVSLNTAEDSELGRFIKDTQQFITS